MGCCVGKWSWVGSFVWVVQDPVVIDVGTKSLKSEEHLAKGAPGQVSTSGKHSVRSRRWEVEASETGNRRPIWWLQWSKPEVLGTWTESWLCMNWGKDISDSAKVRKGEIIAWVKSHPFSSWECWPRSLLGFELKPSHLLVRHSTTWATLLLFFVMGIFKIVDHKLFPWPDFELWSSWSLLPK
jgi:hypothetical protein